MSRRFDMRGRGTFYAFLVLGALAGAALCLLSAGSSDGSTVLHSKRVTEPSLEIQSSRSRKLLQNVGVSLGNPEFAVARAREVQDLLAAAIANSLLGGDGNAAFSSSATGISYDQEVNNAVNDIIAGQTKTLADFATATSQRDARSQALTDQRTFGFPIVGDTRVSAGAVGASITQKMIKDNPEEGDLKQATVISDQLKPLIGGRNGPGGPGGPGGFRGFVRPRFTPGDVFDLHIAAQLDYGNAGDYQIDRSTSDDYDYLDYVISQLGVTADSAQVTTGGNTYSVKDTRAAGSGNIWGKALTPSAVTRVSSISGSMYGQAQPVAVEDAFGEGEIPLWNSVREGGADAASLMAGRSYSLQQPGLAMGTIVTGTTASKPEYVNGGAANSFSYGSGSKSVGGRSQTVAYTDTEYVGFDAGKKL